ncbi:MAG TPA: VOC family protein [Gemmatimonadaceae bacterium]|jgi:methylmalonyl-CoA/ethylmalonyl-CoA epimerase|nr:VOC family protein [Gemmatimonadaceae bacterium]
MEQSTSGVSLGRIRQIAIIVKDVERATKFYRDVLGMKFLFEVPGLSFFDAGGVRLMLGKADGPETEKTSSILYYIVPDIIGAHKVLEEKGVEIMIAPRVVAPMPDHDLWISDYKDSEGNIFALMSEVPRDL